MKYMNCIVFGVYNGYTTLKTEKGGLYYFIKSLREYNQNSKVVIVCEKKNVFDDLVHFSKEMNFEIYSEFDLEFSMMSYRFLIYKKYLYESKEKFDKILLADTNDVIFQEDPFCIEFVDELYCALEDSILTDTSNWSSNLNMSWIHECDHIYNNMNNYINQNIVCAGTILGTYQGINKYLDFYENVQKKKQVNDQGVYNIYIHNYLFSKKMLQYKKSKILTLDRISFDSLHVRKKDGKYCIVNEKGEKYSIIHQINRCNLPFMLSLV